VRVRVRVRTTETRYYDYYARMYTQMNNIRKNEVKKRRFEKSKKNKRSRRAVRLMHGVSSELSDRCRYFELKHTWNTVISVRHQSRLT
jgi:hypothetical protein